jgi:hypothetical protein
MFHAFSIVIARPTGPAKGRPKDRLRPGDPDVTLDAPRESGA